MIIDREVAKAIRNATSAELKTIIALVKERQSSLQREAAVTFAVGDKVRFDAGKRGIVEGVITKINRKTIMVKASHGVGFIWRVAPSLLKKVA